MIESRLALLREGARHAKRADRAQPVERVDHLREDRRACRRDDSRKLARALAVEALDGRVDEANRQYGGAKHWRGAAHEAEGGGDAHHRGAVALERAWQADIHVALLGTKTAEETSDGLRFDEANGRSDDAFEHLIVQPAAGAQAEAEDETRTHNDRGCGGERPARKYAQVVELASALGGCGGGGGGGGCDGGRRPSREPERGSYQDELGADEREQCKCERAEPPSCGEPRAEDAELDGAHHTRILCESGS